jgi:hypothetical protein
MKSTSRVSGLLFVAVLINMWPAVIHMNTKVVWILQVSLSGSQDSSSSCMGANVRSLPACCQRSVTFKR